MTEWIKGLRVDPCPTLLASEDSALRYFVARDVCQGQVGSVRNLWESPEVLRLVKKQQDNGAWHYPGRNRDIYTYVNYDLLETYRNLRVLVEMYGSRREFAAVGRAAEYVLSCQTDEGDMRGIIGNQCMPYYHGAITELLVKAGYGDDERVRKGYERLLSVRQDDGGWMVPAQAVPAKEKTEDMWRGEPVAADRSLPSSHLATGMVLRAFAAHPEYRLLPEAQAAGRLLKSRFFQADKYNDRKAPSYWIKFQYPFWWSNLLTALDSLSKMDFAADDGDVERGLEWFVSHQEADGLWPTGYGQGKKAAGNRMWVGLAICRVFRRFHEGG